MKAGTDPAGSLEAMAGISKERSMDGRKKHGGVPSSSQLSPPCQEPTPLPEARLHLNPRSAGGQVKLQSCAEERVGLGVRGGLGRGLGRGLGGGRRCPILVPIPGLTPPPNPLPWLLWACRRAWHADRRPGIKGFPPSAPPGKRIPP